MVPINGPQSLPWACLVSCQLYLLLHRYIVIYIVIYIVKPTSWSTSLHRDLHRQAYIVIFFISLNFWGLENGGYQGVFGAIFCWYCENFNVLYRFCIHIHTKLKFRSSWYPAFPACVSRKKANFGQIRVFLHWKMFFAVIDILLLLFTIKKSISVYNCSLTLQIVLW